MARTELKKVLEQAEALAGQQITVCGWVKTIRDSKALGFIELNDGSSFSNLQVVFEDANISNFKEIAKCNVGTALRVTGTLMLTPNAKQPCEIHACEVVVEGVSAPDYPLQKKRHSLGISAHYCPSASQDQYLQRGFPCPFGGGVCHP